MTDWTPVRHEDLDPGNPAPTANEPVAERETQADAKTIPLSLVMSVPPELIAALSSLAGTMERVATEVAAQGKAIQALAEAIKPPDRNTTLDAQTTIGLDGGPR